MSAVLLGLGLGPLTSDAGAISRDLAERKAKRLVAEELRAERIPYHRRALSVRCERRGRPLRYWYCFVRAHNRAHCTATVEINDDPRRIEIDGIENAVGFGCD